MLNLDTVSNFPHSKKCMRNIITKLNSTYNQATISQIMLQRPKKLDDYGKQRNNKLILGHELAF